MKRTNHLKGRSLLLGSALVGSLFGAVPQQMSAQQAPDSVYIFAFCPTDNGGREGLKVAWSENGQDWNLFENFSWVKSDFGEWGSQKQMHSPHIIMLPDGTFAATWQLNDKANQYAVTTTPDFIHWMPQDYPYTTKADVVIEPKASYRDGKYYVTFHDSKGNYYTANSTDFREFTDAVPTQKQTAPANDVVTIKGEQKSGQMFRLPYSRFEKMQEFYKMRKDKGAKNAESSADNAKRFSGINHVNANVKIDLNDNKAISDKLIGIFFEDINYSADGGLYGELIQNRDFEYDQTERGHDKSWNNSKSWTAGDGGTLEILTVDPIHPNNLHYGRLSTQNGKVSLTNEGFDGIPLKKGEKYDFSLFTRVAPNTNTKGAVKLTVELLGDNGVVLDKKDIKVKSNKWEQLSCVLTPKADCKGGQLRISTSGKSALALDVDMISLFPQDTFKGRKNGLRKDLAQVLVDMNPQFMRFPGGCVAHGNGIDNIYDWKGSIGPLESRKPLFNIWGYHQSRGLGYYEYFLFCEDAGMEPVPVIAAGVPCQNSARGGHGQQGGIDMADMETYAQDICDLIEYANGDPATNEWARKRAEAGHPEPFNLKYVGIGNEDMFSKVFEDRYLMLIDYVSKRYPDITIIGTVGPFYEGSDYERGWELAKANDIAMVDEHYYNPPAWYIYNQDFYDNYDRNASKVYLGEYAAHDAKRKNTIETALCAAMHITNLERNGDVVMMSSYAPLLAKNDHTQWRPDMIYFTNNDIDLSADYWAQHMCGNASGDTYHRTTLSTDQDSRQGLRERLAASTVTDSKTGKTYIKLVNLTGIPTTFNLDLNGLQGSTNAKTITLTGDWNETEVNPVEGSIQLSANTAVEVAPYTFMVIEK